MKCFLSFFLYLLAYFSFLIAQEQVRPWMGIAIEDNPNGVAIKAAIPGTPAEKAGFRPGDLVKKIDSVPMKSASQLIEYVQSKGVGNEVSVEYERNKKLLNLKLHLEARPDELELVRKQVLNTKIPDFQLEEFNKVGIFTNKNIQNRVTVIEFWATWCGACVTSHARLSEFAKANHSIAVLAVSNEKKEIIQKYISKVKPNFTTLRDSNGKFTSHFRVSAIPMTIVVDKKGIVQFATLGSGTALEDALQFATKLEK